jgi:PAS domain S-box-containing protein
MKNNERLSDLIEIEARGVSSDCLITCSRTWLTVADVMSKNVATISPDETVVSAAKTMSDKRVSCLAVMDGGQVAGILTETDMLRRVARNGKRFYHSKLEQIMSVAVKSVSPDMSVLEASNIMSETRIKRLPVLEEGKLVGIVTQTDLVRALTSYGLWRDVSEIMSHDVAVIPEDATIAKAAELMTLRRISCIVVLDGGEAVGVLTQKDMLRRVVALQRDPVRVRVRDVMSSPVASVVVNCSVFSASKMMEEMNVRRLVVTEGKELAGVVTQTDIFKAVRDKLQAEEERNLSLLDKSNNSVYTTDLDGVITYVNPAFLRLLEVSDPAELVGERFLPDRFGLDSQERDVFLTELKNGSIESRELTLKTSLGKQVYVTVFPSVTRNVRGEINGSQGIVYDVTAKKELVALREAEQELESVNKDLALAVRELQRANKELQEFAHIAAHDLKTPLRAIGSIADGISTDYSDKFDEKGREQVRLLVRKTRQMSALVDDVLQYSRLGRDDRKKRPIKLNAILSQIVSENPPPENIEITVQDNLPTIMCEETQILQVFQNLFNNAIKYMDKPKGQIKVGCVDDGNFWKFGVTDNGPGIDKSHFEMIFRLFQTLSPPSGVESTGIGLSIVRKIAELNGGDSWVESEVGKGSTFFFTLPKVAS